MYNTKSGVRSPAAWAGLLEHFIKAGAETRTRSSSAVRSEEKPPECEASLSFAASKSRAAPYASTPELAVQRFESD
ncbi:uncharacterized [Tachysurus ichikawai]